MPRVISTDLRRALEEPRSNEYIVILLEITHPQISQPIRVANDVVDYRYDSNLYIGFPFIIEVVTDNERVPRGQLSIQNVDQRISDAIIDLTTPPKLRIICFANSDFTDEIVDGARNAVGVITPEYEANHLVFNSISIDAMKISGDITSFDMASEPWPAIRSTADRLPGLDP